MVQFRVLTLIMVHIMVFVTIQASNTVPVLLLDEGLLDGAIKSELDPFQEVKQDVFATLMQKVEQISKTTIFFIDENLSLQDIMAKDYKGTSFPILRKEFVNKKLKIFLQVENPYSYIKSRYPPFGFNKFYLKSTASKLTFDNIYKYTFIYFEDDGNETRIELLRKHDAIIRQVYFAVKQLAKGPVIAVYTAKHGLNEEGFTDWAHSEKPKNCMEFNCDSVKFEFYGTKLLKKEPLVPLEADVCVFTKLDQTRWAYNLRLKHDASGQTHTYNLQFVFTHVDPNDENVGWRAVEANYDYGHEGNLKETQKLDFAVNWTTEYVSETPLIMIPSGGNFHPTLTIDKYVIFLKRPGSSSQDGVEGDNRGPKNYYKYAVRNNPPGIKKVKGSQRQADVATNSPEILATPALLMAFMVVTLLVSVLLFGVNMIMSVNTNSKYDSPDTKPLFDPDSIKE